MRVRDLIRDPRRASRFVVTADRAFARAKGIATALPSALLIHWTQRPARVATKNRE